MNIKNLPRLLIGLGALFVFGFMTIVVSRFTLAQQKDSDEPTIISDLATPDRYRRFSGLFQTNEKGQGILGLVGRDDVRAMGQVQITVLPGMPTVSPKGQNERTSRYPSGSDLIVIGTVNQKSAFVNENKTFLLTEYVVSVESIVGNRAKTSITVGDEIRVIRPGGHVLYDGIRIRATDMAYGRLETGKPYALFLKSVPGTETFYSFDPRGSYSIQGDTVVSVNSSDLSTRSKTKDAFLDEIRSTILNDNN